LAERQQSADLLSSHLDNLDGRLNEMGFSIHHLSCRQALVTPVTPVSTTRLNDYLVDISV